MARAEMAHADSGTTHINDLPDDVLARIFWPPKQPTLCKFESNNLWSVASTRPKYIDGNITREERFYGRRDTPMPTPPASADAAYTLLLASICRRWRVITQRHVSSLIVKEGRVVSHQDVLNAVACLPHLTHLHLSDSSVEILDNAFLANLAAACPRLKAFPVGKLIVAGDDEGGKKHSLITKPGLDNFFHRCPDLEHLSLYCLRKNVRPPASFFQLQNLRTLVMTNTFILRLSKCNSLASLTALSIETTCLHYEQLSNLLHLTNLTSLSLPNEIRLISETPAFSLAELPLLSSLKVGVYYAQLRVFFPLRFPYRSLKRLQLVRCDEQESFPDSIGEVMPCLKELRVCNCRFLTDLTDQFTSLSCLEKLSISLCSINSLPRDFGNLSTLKTLVLEFLPLLYLPDSFTRLASLETFFLLGCEEMDELPPGFGCLTGLQTLHLSSPVLCLPDDLGELTNLHTFRLKKSTEDQLPLSFTHLVSLTILDLDDCSIGELPEGFGEMTNLQELYIQNCSDIQGLPEWLTALVSLRVLRIENCFSLSSIPWRLDSLTRLEQLELRGCENLNGTLQTLPSSLQVLLYQNSQLAVPLPDMSGLSELRDLQLGFVDAAGLLTITANLSGLERLVLALGADGGEAEEFLFTLTSLFRLRTLTLMGARINVSSLQKLLESDGSALQELRQLCVYALSDGFTRLPLAITTLQHLTSLQIHAPYLSSLPDELRVFSRLRQLDLSNCSSLTLFPASLTDLSCLTDLNISSTSVCSLPRGLSRLRRLKNLDLDNCKQLKDLPDDEIQDLPMLDSLSTEGCEADRQISDILADILFGDDDDFIL